VISADEAQHGGEDGLTSSDAQIEVEAARFGRKRANNNGGRVE
jgi:hypothetical protein